jgi:hypothetical protein
VSKLEVSKSRCCQADPILQYKFWVYKVTYEVTVHISLIKVDDIQLIVYKKESPLTDLFIFAPLHKNKHKIVSRRHTPTQPPVQRVPRVLSSGVKRRRGLTLTAHSHLVPRS